MVRQAVRVSPPVGRKHPGRGAFARVLRVSVWVWMLGGPGLQVSHTTPTTAAQVPGGAAGGVSVTLVWPEARAQVSAVSALWRELDALRMRWRVDAATLRIDVDRFRERVARRRWQLRRQKGGTSEP